jgi:hypothetical protein
LILQVRNFEALREICLEHSPEVLNAAATDMTVAVLSGAQMILPFPAGSS